MNWFKKIIISILIIVFLLLTFYKPKKINLEGNWETTRIILDGKKIYPDTLEKFISIAPEIVINSWKKSISIPIYRKNIEAHLHYLESKKQNYKIRLSSNEKSLNGIFVVTIDTFNIKPESYTVDVKLKSNKTLIHFQKHIIIPPWKPELPRRGMP